MRRQLLALPLVVSFAVAGALAAEAPATDSGLDDEALSQAVALRDAAGAGTEAYQLLRSLTVEASPRFAGTPGDRAGVEWGLATMRRLGFDDIRAEPVTVPQWVRGEEAGWILDPSLRPVVLSALGGSVGTARPDLTAEVVPVVDLDALLLQSLGLGAGGLGRLERLRDAGERLTEELALLVPDSSIPSSPISSHQSGRISIDPSINRQGPALTGCSSP